ncbi:hypothetical protein RHGRI_038603 [Rhododendron griersonianum]|uniref:DUF3752 domain-containing protein n=1 Tax=Rhododendron griersonianum TaxID=479676 RepID=A0AAV6HMV9_9ERIC|nr:hypothetical protein RHGRI_038603 [Rhododendron griersonianum]
MLNLHWSPGLDIQKAVSVAGISMEGDDVLLVEMDVKVGTKRDEWMTTLPPERKHAVTTQSTKFSSRTCKDGRGDTSMWTDTPSEKAQKAKMKAPKLTEGASNGSPTAIASQQEKVLSLLSLLEKEPPSLQFSCQLDYIHHLSGLERHEIILPLLHAPKDKKANGLDFLMAEFAG